MSLTQSRSFSVHERQSIEVAAGDRLLLLGNRKEEHFRATNGEIATVRSVGSNGIELEDGRTMPANYCEFTHGYAVTAHRSQGKTVDKVIISADQMPQELFYVSAPRGREKIAIITSDMERLANPSASRWFARLQSSLRTKSRRHRRCRIRFGEGFAEGYSAANARD